MEILKINVTAAEVLDYALLQLRKAKVDLAHAEARKGVTSVELDNIHKKIAILDLISAWALERVGKNGNHKRIKATGRV